MTGQLLLTEVCWGSYLQKNNVNSLDINILLFIHHDWEWRKVNKKCRRVAVAVLANSDVGTAFSHLHFDVKTSKLFNK